LQETQEKRTKEQQTTTTTTTTTNNTQDDQRDDVRREYYSEKRYNRTERHRSPSETSDISTSHGIIDEEFKKKYLRCLAYMKLIERLYENQQESDDDLEVKHRRLSRRVCLHFFIISYFCIVACRFFFRVFLCTNIYTL
jgi:hypothetical protein